MPSPDFDVAPHPGPSETTGPLVTVCVPTIGRAAMLEQTLQSLRQQTYPHLEILLLDNASPPAGQQVLARFAASDTRARVLRVEQRLPMFANFNRGIRVARGEYVTFFFDDDVYLPSFIARQLAMLQTHPSAGFVGSNYFLIDDDGTVTRFPGLVREDRVVPGRRFIREQVRNASMIVGTPGIMYRRDLISAFPFDESLPIHGGDLVLRLRMAEVADVAVLAEPLVQIRVHPVAETSSLSLTQGVALRARLLRDYITEYSQRWPDDRSFVRSLRRGLVSSYLTVVLWDWIALGEDAAAAERLAGLRSTSEFSKLAAVLATVDRLGFSASRRKMALAPLLRRLGRIAPESLHAHRPLQ